VPGDQRDAEPADDEPNGPASDGVSFVKPDGPELKPDGPELKPDDLASAPTAVYRRPAAGSSSEDRPQ
jgi:hypothetical protein